MPTQPLPNHPSLENLRKQAKALRKAVSSNQEDALLCVLEFHPRTKAAVATFSLSDAQLVIARRHAFESWSKLKRHVELIDAYAWSGPGKSTKVHPMSPADQFIDLACLTYERDHTSRRDEARALLIANPSIAAESIFSAATVGDVSSVRRMLDRNPSLARSRGGPRNWEPLLYAVYSRFNSALAERSTLEVVRLLLRHGADPNAGFLWDGFYLFTALTGVFGEGESGSVNQPEHPQCNALARLLLDAGADPNDNQTLYNRMFRSGTAHLELLFEYGLGKDGNGVWFKRLGHRLDSPAQMLEAQLCWAAQNNHFDRVQLLVRHGVNVNKPDIRFRRAPYELALRSGNAEIAQFLLDNGARQTALTDLEAFAAACLRADSVQARKLLAKDPSLVDQLGAHRTELLNAAAGEDRRDAVRLMSELRFNVNEVGRTAPLHQAAWSGHLEMVKLLIELGADPLLRDAAHDARPIGWARYNHKSEVVEFLEQFEPVD